uniref:Reverse transcriptase domain-containing protein n=1 Tax=Arundo donax TaxID=35708 RepID=A0A0A9HT25_ARUDO
MLVHATSFSDSHEITRGLISSMLKTCGPTYIPCGIRVSRHAPWVSHLMFADDCLIFSEASVRGADRVATILEEYHRGSFTERPAITRSSVGRRRRSKLS